ncbi:MAG: prolyl-tRNA synthetase associated domain-containing protein [Firmicutes bacterium]|nr:prolyl-tRNA synthetase associated domain-containing protein [Bacillota bacterium]
MNKHEIYDFLKSKNIRFEITEHEAVFNMDEVSELNFPHPECVAKNLFVRDDKKHNYYLITVKGDKKVDLKKIRTENQIRPLSFASENDLMEYLGLTAGSVTPLGIMNDKEHRVIVFIDKDFLSPPGIIGVHPNDNTATVWMKTEDLMGLICEHRNEIKLIQI